MGRIGCRKGCFIGWPGALFAVALAVAVLPAAARAGGFEFPANGTEALGRGGAFTAKADSPLALDYNIAGLAGQRGTRLLFDSNLLFSNYSLQYPQSLGGGSVTDQASKPFYNPWFGVSSDFGFFDHWTFAVGAYGPSSIGQRSYSSTSLTRYDVTSTNVLVVLPTVAAAFRANRYLDIGLAFHDAIGSYKLGNTSYVHVTAACPGTDLTVTSCDSTTQLAVSSYFNPMLSLGVLLHPTRFLDIGFNVRTAANVGAKNIQSSGTLTATPPVALMKVLGLSAPQTSNDIEFDNNLPWILRFGVRYAHKNDRREVFDIEADATYELWSQAEGTGDTINGTSPLPPHLALGPMGNGIALPHFFNDTYSLRLGGAFNQPIGPVGLTLRAGGFYDSSATANHPEYTRMDFDTLDKAGGTAGVGLTVRGVTLNLAYAGIHSFSRTVTNGALQPLEGASGTALASAPAVNNGTYTDTIHIVSLGLLVQFDELVRGDDWARRPKI